MIRYLQLKTYIIRFQMQESYVQQIYVGLTHYVHENSGPWYIHLNIGYE